MQILNFTFLLGELTRDCDFGNLCVHMFRAEQERQVDVTLLASSRFLYRR